MYLEIRPGKGNVYIDTYPFTQLDTQVSTRFAKEIACHLADEDCSRHDFFYTIRSGSSIVGGPSAGAAITALTVAVLDHRFVDQKIAMTGTINSGGLVGPVGGIPQKISAAQKAGMHTVVVPRWVSSSLTKNSSVSDENTTVNATTNSSTDNFSSSFPPYPPDSFPWSLPSSYSSLYTPYSSFLSSLSVPETNNSLLSESNQSIDVVKVVTVHQALTVLTNHNYTLPDVEVIPPEQFTSLMSSVADLLCERSVDISSELPTSAIIKNSSLHNQSLFFLNKSSEALAQGNYYSAASYCFTANLRLRQLQLDDFSETRLRSLADELNDSLQEKNVQLRNRSLRTLTDVQTFAIVNERFLEAENYLSQNVSSQSVAFALERYYSGVVWSNFFKLDDVPVALDEGHLKEACEAKLAEVEERQGYLNLLLSGLYVPVPYDTIKEVHALHDSEQYALCLFKASKTKANLDTVLSLTMVSEEDIPEFINQRLKLVSSTISVESENNRFPFMGYSYYEYATQLADDDPYLASLFSSYALELSDLSSYFPKKSGFNIFVFFNPYVIGFLIGMLVSVLFFHKKRTRRNV